MPLDRADIEAIGKEVVDEIARRPHTCMHEIDSHGAAVVRILGKIHSQGEKISIAAGVSLGLLLVAVAIISGAKAGIEAGRARLGL